MYFRCPRLRPVEPQRPLLLEHIKENSLLRFTIAMLAVLVFCGATLTANL
jgi:hypothetical protein